MSTLFTIIVVFLAISLIGIIMMQRSKAGGGLGAMSGGASEAFFGADAGNVLTKWTRYLLAAFLICTLILAMIGKDNEVESVMKDVAAPKVEKTEAPKPETPAATTEAATETATEAAEAATETPAATE